MISRKTSLAILTILTSMVVLVCFALPQIPQPQWYHQFADQRSLWGIPNFGDVLSNAPFAMIGAWGIVFVLRFRHSRRVFVDIREIWPYLLFFAGLLLTAFGSSYYHLAPDNARLVWDRLPMTITFMSIVVAVITERINVRLGVWLLPFLLLVGLASVEQWYRSELRGAGDLRFYAAVQVYSALVILVAMLLPQRYTRSSDFGIVIGFYVLAKTLESCDKPIYGMLGFVSGHTLKHVAAAAAGYWILRMLQRRKPFTVTSAVPLDIRPSVGLSDVSFD